MLYYFKIIRHNTVVWGTVLVKSDSSFATQKIFPHFTDT